MLIPSPRGRRCPADPDRMFGLAAGEQKQGLFWRTIRAAHGVRRKRMHPDMIALEPATLPARRARDNPWFSLRHSLIQIHVIGFIAFRPIPGMPRGGAAAYRLKNGKWLCARVASPRCPILRPGDLSVAGNTLIGQFPSPRSGPDAWQRSSPASVSFWTCWYLRPAQVTLPTSRCKLTVFRDCRPCRGHKATAGIAPRQSPSSRRWGPSVIQGKTRSATFFLQQIIDGKVLMDQREAAGECMRGLLGRESLYSAMADAVELPEIAVNGFEAVVGFASDNVGFLPMGITLPTNDAFVSEAGPHVVQGGAAGEQVSGLAFMLGEDLSDAAVVGAEELGQVTVGKQSALFVGLLTESECLVQEALGIGRVRCGDRCRRGC